MLPGAMQIRDDLSPYLDGPYAPITTEIEGEALPVTGEIPLDLQGIYVRNGPNPRFAPKGRYHWFDGDGMLHAVELAGGKARYKNRYVGSSHFHREGEANAPLWSGVMESIKNNPKDSPYKDTANTDVLFHNGSLLALWYVSGVPVKIDPRSLETTGSLDLATKSKRIAAHAKVDPRTGELFFFDFGFAPPFMHYGVIGRTGTLEHLVPIALPGPRLPHDMAITENYAVLMDLPVVYDEEAMKRARWVTKFDRARASRFAVIPRRGDASSVRWFEASPCYIYHTINAWEEGDEIVMVACRVDDPIPAARAEDGIWAQMLANLRVTAKLCRWRFNLRTGATREEVLDDLNTEFPMIDARVRGVKSRYAYNVQLADTRTLLFDGWVKYDIATGAREEVKLREGQYGSEAPFAPRVGSTGEDDGYVLSYVRDDREDSSELWIIDAKNFSAGPVARVKLPQRVPLGFHSTFVPAAELRG